MRSINSSLHEASLINSAFLILEVSKIEYFGLVALKFNSSELIGFTFGIFFIIFALNASLQISWAN